MLSTSLLNPTVFHTRKQLHTVCLVKHIPHLLATELDSSWVTAGSEENIFSVTTASEASFPQNS